LVRKINPAEQWNGNFSFADHTDRFKRIDINKICRMLGLGPNPKFKNNQNPITFIEIALLGFCNNQIAPHKPKYSERLALIDQFITHADGLKKAYSKMGWESGTDIQNSLANALGQPQPHRNSGYEDLTPELRFFWEHLDDVEKFCDLLSKARGEFLNDKDAPKTGRPKQLALIKLIQDLAQVYEVCTEQPAYQGFTSDPNSGEYSSSFFLLVQEIVASYEPTAFKSNNALGSQIRNALASQKQ